MDSPRYLTKSRFQSGLECPTKLYYTGKPEYADNKLSNEFLTALAKGGFQVGELAKCYFPGGHKVDEINYEASLEKTQKLLLAENVIIYEAAFRYEQLFVRADILVKRGNTIHVYEVKAKSVDSLDESMVKKNGLPNSEWLPYLCDVAFQKHVIASCMRGHLIKAFLIVADKSVMATVEGLNQRFLLTSTANGRIQVQLNGDVSPNALGAKLLCAIPVDDFIERIYNEPTFDELTSKSFKALITHLATHYVNDQLLQGELRTGCKNCEFKDAGPIDLQLKSGFRECWRRVHNFTDEDFIKPSVLDIWNYRGRDKLIADGRFFQTDLSPADFVIKASKEPGMTPLNANYYKSPNQMNRIIAFILTLMAYETYSQRSIILYILLILKRLLLQYLFIVAVGLTSK